MSMSMVQGLEKSKFAPKKPTVNTPFSTLFNLLIFYKK